ncbi:unnamed protein product [Phytophthora fragariaefolia]|uniref:Exportin-1 n=1 Tax=Phytophthora fragariaefolia TaxID=1490495 RepID=A0A9W6Y3A7_9STRA|nr:unnamed protein product [Phytophthora fragariaefolia]
MFVNKMDLVLVQVLKHEWPQNWPSFITDIVNSSKTSEILCENNMTILKLLSEEVFDFSKDQLTEQKTKTLKESLNHEFTQIFQLCEFVLNKSTHVPLLQITLQTLLRFLSWIPLGFIFETDLIKILVTKFLATGVFRNDTISCLSEIAQLRDVPEQYNNVYVQLYMGVLNEVGKILPPGQTFTPFWEQDEVFVQRLSIFFTSFFRYHIQVIERPISAPGDEAHQALLAGFTYLVCIAEVDDDSIFKICLDYWHFFTRDLYTVDQNQMNPLAGFQNQSRSRRELVSPVMNRVRHVMISKMVKPSEVLIVEDENGEIVRETTKDTEALSQYKTMHETLVYLTHLNYDDTETIMLEKLTAQVEGTEWSWNNLNTLCWAIGSISGAMSEENEKRFLVTVIKDLLGLCEMKRGKDNKAVVASNIMYVVGQYPRFLRAHWKFLRTVVNKLFEFMHELHPGVQDMACDTFLKISQKCRRKFVVLQSGEVRPFVEELLEELPRIVSDLETHQVHTFYEAVASMLAAENDAGRKEVLLGRLMNLPNEAWKSIMSQASQDVNILYDSRGIKEIVKIIRTNVKVCKAIGPNGFNSQMGYIFQDMLNVYVAYTQRTAALVEQGGEIAVKTSEVRALRSAKKESLRLMDAFVEHTAGDDSSRQFVATHFLPKLLETILSDYQNTTPSAKESEVLSLLATSINKLKNIIAPTVPMILEAVFECTLQMITKNFEDFPEHRVNFFKLLQAVNDFCFEALFSIPQEHQKLVVDSIIWAFKHTERNVADTAFLKDYVANLIGSSFPNLSRAQVVEFVVGCFDMSKDLPTFKKHLRDFLVNIKEFAGEDNAELFLEENLARTQLQEKQDMAAKLAVPGLVNPNERPDEMADLLALSNRYARYCEDRPMCQRYRALKLQCLANAQAEEDEDDRRPLALVLRKKKEKKKEEEDETFAIPRKKKAEAAGKKRLNLNADAEPIESTQKMKKRGERQQQDEKTRRKRLRRASDGKTNGVTIPTSNGTSVHGSSVSSSEEGVLPAERGKKSSNARARPPADASSNTEAAVDNASRPKKRRLSRHASADDVLSRSASSSPVTPVASHTSWKIPRAKPGKRTTAVQAIRNMDVELVPLGVTSQASFPGGGRYVQNGNRSAAQSLRPSDPRSRPPSLTKFASPAPVPRAPSVVTQAASSRLVQAVNPSIPVPPPAPAQPPSLPPLPPQAPPPSAPRPLERARTVTPSSSPVRNPTVPSYSSSSTTANSAPIASAVPPQMSGVKRISASDYRKNRGNHERQGDQRASPTVSMERSSSLTNERAPAYQTSSSTSSHASRPPEYRRSDRGSLLSSSSSSSDFNRREISTSTDLRQQYSGNGEQFRNQQPSYENDGGRMGFQNRPAVRGDFMGRSSYTSGKWEGRDYPPPHDRYPSRQQEPSVFASNEGRDGGEYDYATDTHYSPASSPVDRPYRRENLREDAPLPPRVTSPRQELERAKRASEYDDMDEDSPTFSYHEVFLPQLLAIFIHKFPHSLDAISNVTKKPRKMNWYVKYVERIERLCQPYDLRVKFESLKAVVTIRGREWFSLKGNSTISLHMEVLKTLRAEAITWRRMYEEMENAYKHFWGIYGSNTSESITFLRAWNDLKRPGNYISLSRQANYFCGARLHHWSFVVGKVEIGSGSHEDKRVAFRMAAESALDFLLKAGKSTRPRSHPSELKREQVAEEERERRWSPGRESAINSRATSNSNGADEANVSPSGTANGQLAHVASSSVAHPVVNSTASAEREYPVRTASTSKPQTSAEPSSSPVAVEHTEEPSAVVIPNTDSGGRPMVANTAEQSDEGEEMSISDASDIGAITPADSPRSPTTHSSSGPGVTAVSNAPSGPSTSVSGSSVIPPPTPTPNTTRAGTASIKDTSMLQTVIKAAMPTRRCMMCEMIRMRKPDGERCLRCQQKDPPANGMLNALDP